ncbi:MAG: hypothetical protein P8I77_00290 [Bacteroidia bacterium]|nr:hypothetical protein [Bacteroidia bacterium]
MCRATLSCLKPIFLLVVGYWLLVIGYWLLVVGCWRLETKNQILETTNHIKFPSSYVPQVCPIALYILPRFFER